MRTRLRFVTILVASIMSPHAVSQESARDAYIEAWFQETAEGDLEAALGWYRKCLDLAGDSDRELSARTLWRMGRIARARGEEVEAKLHFQRVMAEYEGTEAAELAAADSDPSSVGPVATGKTEEKKTARQLLAIMMKQHDEITLERAQAVLRALSVDEIIGIRTNEGGSLVRILDRLDQREFFDVLVDLITDERLADESVVYLDTLCRIPGSTVPPSLEEFLPTVPSGYRDRVVRFLLGRQGSEGIDVLERIIRAHSNREAVKDVVMFLGHGSQLFRSDASTLKRVMEILLEPTLSAELAESLDVSQALENEAARSVVKARYHTLPPKIRLRFAQSSRKGPSGIQDDLLDVILEDPEPAIRTEMISRLISSTEPEDHEAAIGIILGQQDRIDLRILTESLTRGGRVPRLGLVEQFPPGDVREFFYWTVLKISGVNPAEVIRMGLERKDPELVTALLEPGFWRNPDLVSGDWPVSRPGSGLPFSLQALREGLQSLPDQDVGLGLARAVSGHESESVRRAFVRNVLREAGQDRAFKDACPIFARDPSPGVRTLITESSSLMAQLDATTQIALAGDGDASVAVQSILRINDPLVLIGAADRVQAPLLTYLADRAVELQEREAVRAIYEAAPADGLVAVKCLEFLAELDFQVILDALSRSPSTIKPIHEAAIRQLVGLPLREDLSNHASFQQAVLGELSPERLSQLSDLLREHRDAVSSAFRKSRLEDLIRKIEKQGGDDNRLRGYGRRLSILGSGDDLLALARGYQLNVKRAAAYGLALGGHVRQLELLLSSTVHPDQLLDAAIEADLIEAVREQIAVGRIRSDRAIDELMRHGRVGEMAELVCPEGQRPPLTSFDGPNDGRSRHVTLVVEHLAAERDVDRLARMIRYYAAPSAVRALFQLEAHARVLGELSGWPQNCRAEAVKELHRRTGLPRMQPGQSPQWPQFVSEQQEWIAAWREALIR